MKKLQKQMTTAETMMQEERCVVELMCAFKLCIRIVVGTYVCECLNFITLNFPMHHYYCNMYVRTYIFCKFARITVH